MRGLSQERYANCWIKGGQHSKLSALWKNNLNKKKKKKIVHCAQSHQKTFPEFIVLSFSYIPKLSFLKFQFEFV